MNVSDNRQAFLIIVGGGARNEGVGASIPSAHMPFRGADTNLRNSRKPAVGNAGHRMTHHEKSGDFSRWVIRICDSVITNSPRIPDCRLPRISKVHFSTSKRHMCTESPLTNATHLPPGCPQHRKMTAGKRWKGICPADVLEYILEILSRKRQKIGEKMCFRSTFSADPSREIIRFLVMCQLCSNFLPFSA